MTPEPQQHPLRCETCRHRLPDCDREDLGSRVCKKIFLEDPKSLQIGIPYYINIVGCASHRSSPAATDALDELKGFVEEMGKVEYRDGEIWFSHFISPQALLKKIATLRTHTPEAQR